MKSRRDTWTSEELSFLEEFYPKLSAQEIAKRLGRKKHQIYRKAHEMDLRKPIEWIRENARKNSQENENWKATQFRKGHRPHNKGKRIENPHPNSVATQFKKGHKPHNTKEKDGVITIRKHKGVEYKTIRISEGNWKFLNRHIWEDAHGPIPPGHAICYRDGDPMNCQLSNLELVSRAELMKRNTLHQWPPEVKEMILLTNKLTRKIKEHER